MIVPLLLASWSDPSNAQEAPQTCYEWTGSTCSWEPNLQAMRVDFGAQNETFYAYVLPDVSTFYNKTAKSLAAVPVTGFTGMFGKFINMSPETIRVYWEGKEWSYITDIEPFGSSGTATYTGHKFVATPLRSTSTVLIRWTMESETSLYYYDPFQFDIQKAHKKLTADQFTYYRMQWRNKIFAEQYRAYTGRDWLALYQLKQPPRFHMWPADSLGQVHVVETKEIHFVEMPESDELDRGMSQCKIYVQACVDLFFSLHLRC